MLIRFTKILLLLSLFCSCGNNSDILKSNHCAQLVPETIPVLDWYGQDSLPFQMKIKTGFNNLSSKHHIIPVNLSFQKLLSQKGRILAPLCVQRRWFLFNQNEMYYMIGLCINDIDKQEIALSKFCFANKKIAEHLDSECYFYIKNKEWWEFLTSICETKSFSIPYSSNKLNDYVEEMPNYLSNFYTRKEYNQKISCIGSSEAKDNR